MSDSIQGAEMTSRSFADYVSSERERLGAARNEWLAEKYEAERHLSEIDLEFAAIDAYERAKTGKSVKADAAPRAKRARDGSRRQEIIDAIAASPNGMSRGELIEHFGVKGDKTGEMSISNALTAVTKAGQAERIEGRYYVNKAVAQAAE